MIVTRHISLDDGHVEKIKPYLEVHKGNFGAAVGEMIKQVGKRSSRMNSSAEEISLFNWMIEEVRDTLVPEDVLDNLIDSSLMKSISLIAFTLLLTYSALSSEALADTNLVANPSFESDSITSLNWAFVTNSVNTPSWDINSPSNGLTFSSIVTVPYITYDNFESRTYTLHDGDMSPNRKWNSLWNGYGSSGVKKDSTGNNIFFMYPSTSQAPDETSSSLVISTGKFSDFEFTINTKTVQQLRQNSPPNLWETAWVMFRFTDMTHYFYFTVKTNGIELGKYDGGSQTFLYTANSPKLTIGQWSTWRINVVGNHIIIYVDGVKAVDYIDSTMSNQLKSGSIGMYNEDSNVNFDNIKFKTI